MPLPAIAAGIAARYVVKKVGKKVAKKVAKKVIKKVGKKKIKIFGKSPQEALNRLSADAVKLRKQLKPFDRYLASETKKEIQRKLRGISQLKSLIRKAIKK